jgi:hypothetical protein
MKPLIAPLLIVSLVACHPSGQPQAEESSSASTMTARIIEVHKGLNVTTLPAIIVTPDAPGHADGVATNTQGSPAPPEGQTMTARADTGSPGRPVALR